MAKRKNNGSDAVKRALLDELAGIRRGLERVFTRAELAKDPEYALARRLEKWAKDLRTEPKKPFLLVTVNGGVAEVYHLDPGAEIDIFDFDNWNAGDNGPEDRKRSEAIAARLPPDIGKKFLEELDE